MMLQKHLLYFQGLRALLTHCKIVPFIFQLKNKDDFDNCTGFEPVKPAGSGLNPDGSWISGSWTFKPTKVIAAVESFYFNCAVLCHYRKALTTSSVVLATIVRKETQRLEYLSQGCFIFLTINDPI